MGVFGGCPRSTGPSPNPRQGLWRKYTNPVHATEWGLGLREGSLRLGLRHPEGWGWHSLGPAWGGGEVPNEVLCSVNALCRGAGRGACISSQFTVH